MSDTVLYSIADGVATITLNRPQVMNALDVGTMRGLREAAERAERDASARVVVVRGAGPAFLAGGDVALFHANLLRMPALVREGGDRVAPYDPCAAARAQAGAGSRARRGGGRRGESDGGGGSLHRGGGNEVHDGLQQARHESRRRGNAIRCRAWWALARRWSSCCCRMRSTRRRRSRWGWSTGWWARSRLGAETEAIARRLAQGATVAFGEIKRLVNAGATTRPLAAQLDAEKEAFARCAGTRDFAEGVTAFVEKRKPKFKGN